MDTETSELLQHIRAQVKLQQREVDMYYAGLKLKLPAYLKTLTLNQLRDAGATIDPNVYLPKRVETYFRSQAKVASREEQLREKLEEILNQHRSQIVTYYENLKQNLPKEMLRKRLGELETEDWACLGIDIGTFRDKKHRVGRKPG